MKLREIPIEGGSPRGVGFWSKVLGYCPRAALLGGMSTHSKALLTGSIAHTMMAEWHRTGGKIQLRDYLIIGEDGNPIKVASEEYQEAARCYRAYITAFKPNRFGKVVAVEREFTDAGGLYSYKPDLLTLKGGRRIVVDWKFVGQISHEVVQGYLDSLSAVTYLVSSKADELRYILISKQKEVTFAERIRERRPDDDARYSAFLAAITRANVTLSSAVNPTSCVRWNNGRQSYCPHYRNGCFGY